MPFVNIQIVGTATREQKQSLVKEVTASIARILDKDPNRTSVVIHEVDPDNWGIGGMLRDDWLMERKKGQSGPGGDVSPPR